jgi:hypothetical protein
MKHNPRLSFVDYISPGSRHSDSHPVKLLRTGHSAQNPVRRVNEFNGDFSLTIEEHRL